MLNSDFDLFKPPLMSHATTPTSPAPEHPLTKLPPEDLDLIAALVLESGSLKGLAKRYSVSYPTIRTRLDRVIERLRGLVEGRPRDPLSEMLADLVERGQITTAQARDLLAKARTPLPTEQSESPKHTPGTRPSPLHTGHTRPAGGFA